MLAEDVDRINHRLSRSSPNLDYGNARNPIFYDDQMEDEYEAMPRQAEVSIHHFIELKSANQTMRWILYGKRLPS
jgi:hypothetical protein